MSPQATECGPAEAEVIGTTAEFAALREEWTDLLVSSDSNCLFLTWEWLYTWWRHLAGRTRLALVAVRNGDQLIGLAPLCSAAPNGLAGHLMPGIGFLGTGFVGSDYLDCIVRRGYEPLGRNALAAHLARRRVRLDCRQVRRPGSFVGALALQLEQAGWNYEYQATNVCPFIPLAGLTWEEYLGTLGSEHRYAFHRKTRRLSKEHTVSFDAVQTEEECREAINVTIELHNRRWRERGGSDAFHTEELVAFHRDFSLLALGRGWLRLFVLRLDGRVAACIYAFQYAGKMYFYQSGFEMEFERESVGLVAMGLAIRKAIEEGSEEFDLLHGNETYKSHWSKVSREIGRLEVYPPGRLGAVCRSSFELERASRRFAKRLLPTL